MKPIIGNPLDDKRSCKRLGKLLIRYCRLQQKIQDKMISSGMAAVEQSNQEIREMVIASRSKK